MWAAVSQRLHGWSALVGLTGFVWCALNHVCCGGHREHPPYGWWHYAIDAGWVTAFATAMASGVARRNPYLATPALLGALAMSRLGTGSGGGFFLLLELLAVLVAAALAFVAALSQVEAVTTTQPLQ